MPKEISHWVLAETIKGKIPEVPVFSRPVTRFPNLFFYGAVAPDTPYYYAGGPHRQFVQKCSDIFHVPDNSVVLRILGFLYNMPERDPAALAFAAGLVCHVLADTVFHPVVGFFSGKAGRDPGAVTRHHLFETAMDYYFWRRASDPSRVSLGRIIKEAEISKPGINRFLATLFQVQHDSRRGYLRAALEYHVALTYLFRARGSVRFFNFLYRKGHLKSSRNRALLYPFASPVIIPFFEGSLHYRHPANGTRITAGMGDLVRDFVKKTVALLDIIGGCIRSGLDLKTVMAHPDMPDISPEVPGKNFHFWAGKSGLKTTLFKDVRPDRNKAIEKIDRT